MTAPDTKAIRAQMDALAGHTAGPVAGSSDRHPHNLWAKFDNWRNPNHGAAYKTQMSGYRRYVRDDLAAPDMRSTILALCDAQDSLCNALDEARAENERLKREVDVAASAMVRNHNRAEKAEAEIERLGRDLNMAKYGEPDFAWSTHLGVMADLRDENERLRNFIVDFSETKFDRIDRRAPDPQDDLDPLTDYLAVEAWQEDARAALAQKDAADE